MVLIRAAITFLQKSVNSMHDVEKGLDSSISAYVSAMMPNRKRQDSSGGHYEP